MSMRILLFLIVCLSASSCSKNLKYFTENLRQEYSWDKRELKKIQFYLSEDIVLYKRRTSESSRITNGKIVVKDGVKVDEITFKKGTPGLAVLLPSKNQIGVSFEDNEDNFLMFGPNKKAGGKYVLLAKEWNRSQGKVTYNNQTYYTTSESAYASLLVDLKGAKKVDYNSRQAGGRKIN